MTAPKHIRNWWLAAALVIAAAALFGCATATGEPVTPPTPTPSPTSIPSPSPTPTSIPQVLLIASGPVAWEDSLGSWVIGSGWQLNVPDLPTASTYLQGSSAVIAAVSVQEALDGDLQLAAGQGISVVMVDAPGVDPGPSLSIVGNGRYDQAGFLAGVMTGLASQTGWAGQVTATGGPQEAAYGAGFAQGLLWGCPKCELVSQPAAEMTVDGFRAKGVDVVFPFPGPAADEVAELLGAGGLPMVWVGEGGPPAETRVGRVIFEADRMVVPALEALMETGEGKAWPYSIESRTILLVDINADLLSPGRQRLLEEAYEAIAAGDLDIGTDPEAP
ncbi:MAG: hypothetical protein BMS9Abin28_1318 [Anaerolineae bacterium]|nr:MAG: hypothetical protein BMS9Abin28_1318 [Anaerolineae bacterium]